VIPITLMVKMNVKKSIIWVLSWLIFFQLIGQEKQLNISLLHPIELPSQLSALPDQIADTIALNKLLKEWISLNQQKGWLEMSLDDIQIQEDTAFISIHIGQLYQIEIKPTDDELFRILKKNRLDWIFNQKIPFNPVDVERILDRISAIFEDMGFPFAQTSLTTIHVADGIVTSKIIIDKGPAFTIKELVNAGDAKISDRFLSRYSGLRPGSTFSRKKIMTDLPLRLRDLPYTIQRRDPVVQFSGNDAVVNVFLNKRNASRFDFVLGALPGNAETGRLVFTGTMHMELQNQFGLGERALISFQRLRPETQELRAEFSYPYPLDLPFGIDVSFGLYSRDTTNRDLVFQTGLSYLLPGGNFIKGFWHRFDSDLLSVDANRILINKRLPQNLDITHNLYGLELYYDILDYRFNPKSGWRFKTTISSGFRKIHPNQSIINIMDPQNPEFNYASLYDTVSLSNWQFRFQAEVSRFISLAKRSTILLSLRSGIIESPGILYRNESFRIGGNRMLRGFDEESIFSSHYHIWTTEYRLLTGANSYLFVFGDISLLKNQTAEEIFWDSPYGFGTGLTFETPLGIFGLTLAQGAQQGNPLDFRATKLHFGYISLF
jgi:outer membrane protein assembly factor BamA